MGRIVLDKLGKRFGVVEALRDLNLEIADAELIALLGPSGCGKTTTLLMLAGIYKPTSGQILFDGVAVNDLPPQDRHIGMVFQSYALYPHMTVFDNIASPLRLLRRPVDEIQRRVLEAAALVQIETLMDRRPSQLSGGQQQRTALARGRGQQPARGGPTAGQVAFAAEGMRLQAGDLTAPHLAGRRGGPVLVGARPEDIRLS